MEKSPNFFKKSQFFTIFQKKESKIPSFSLSLHFAEALLEKTHL